MSAKLSTKERTVFFMPALSLDVIHLSLYSSPSPDAMELPVDVCNAASQVEIERACTRKLL